MCGFKSHLLHGNIKRVDLMVYSFYIRSRADLEPRVQGLRSASVGAKQTSPGRLAPHLLRVSIMKIIWRMAGYMCQTVIFMSRKTAAIHRLCLLMVLSECWIQKAIIVFPFVKMILNGLSITAGRFRWRLIISTCKIPTLAIKPCPLLHILR